MRKRVYLFILTAFTAATLSVVGSAPAGAVTYVDVKATDVTVAADKCKDARVTISGDWVDAEATVTVTAPSGDTFASGSFTDTTGVLDLTVSMCGSDDAGIYEVLVDVYDHSDDTTVSGSDTFTLTTLEPEPLAASRILTQRVHKPGQAFEWVVAGKLLRDGRAYKREPVELQAKIDGTWLMVESSKSNRKGIVGWRFKPNRFQWRFHFAGDRDTRASNGKAFRTPGRGHARVMTGVSPESFVRG